MIKHVNIRKGIKSRRMIDFKVYSKLYIYLTLKQAKNAFIELLKKEIKK